ncbi:hypothetical protein [Microbulbifer epialgicus]|uniref:Uncharacterized protein n=1 Tax=Microbulbifer epialgicus TaxID=393907 RepID=A0ABV4P2Z1_9GAMM
MPLSIKKYLITIVILAISTCVHSEVQIDSHSSSQYLEKAHKEISGIVNNEEANIAIRRDAIIAQDNLEKALQKVNELNRKIESLEKRIKSYEDAIKKYKELTRNLKSKLKEQKNE